MIVQNWPQQPENDLRIDTAWRESYSGATINRKFHRTIRAGVHQGFSVLPAGGLAIKVMGEQQDSVAVVECGGYALTARMPEPVVKTLELSSGKNYRIVIAVEYRMHDESKVAIKAVDQFDYDGHCLLATVRVPVGAQVISNEMIDPVDYATLITMAEYTRLVTAYARMANRELDRITLMARFNACIAKQSQQIGDLSECVAGFSKSS